MINKPTPHRGPRRTTIRKYAAAGAVAALVALTSCGGSVDDADPEERSFAVTGDRLTIDKDAGDLDVQPADVDQVQVTRWFASGSAFGRDGEATWELADDTLTLTTGCGGLFGGCEVRYEVLVPREVNLTVEGESGRITASEFGADLEIRTENGAVEVTDATGNLRLASENGDVDATGVAAGRVDVNSQNGQVNLSFASVPDEVEVTTENGAVMVEVPDAAYRVTTNTDSGEVRVEVPEDVSSPHAITVQTDNAAITLRTAGYYGSGTS